MYETTMAAAAPAWGHGWWWVALAVVAGMLVRDLWRRHHQSLGSDALFDGGLAALIAVLAVGPIHVVA